MVPSVDGYMLSYVLYQNESVLPLVWRNPRRADKEEKIILVLRIRYKKKGSFTLPNTTTTYY
jgi:hypothetical protein